MGIAFAGAELVALMPAAGLEEVPEVVGVVVVQAAKANDSAVKTGQERRTAFILGFMKEVNYAGAIANVTKTSTQVLFDHI
jgi:hypothetical protein